MINKIKQRRMLIAIISGPLALMLCLMTMACSQMALTPMCGNDYTHKQLFEHICILVSQNGGVSTPGPFCTSVETSGMLTKCVAGYHEGYPGVWMQVSESCKYQTYLAGCCWSMQSLSNHSVHESIWSCGPKSESCRTVRR